MSNKMKHIRTIHILGDIIFENFKPFNSLPLKRKKDENVFVSQTGNEKTEMILNKKNDILYFPNFFQWTENPCKAKMRKTSKFKKKEKKRRFFKRFQCYRK